MPYLEYNGQTRVIGPGVLIIGCGREAGWRIEDRRLDRVHALVSIERDGRVLVSRGSEVAWVELNGHPLSAASAELRPGDEIRLGDAVFKLSAGVPHAPEEEHGAYLRDVRRERWYKLTDLTAIGRDLTCAVLILDPDISRTHAEVVRQGDAYQLHPRRGVTVLNGKRVQEPTVLAEDDELTLGQTLLRFTTVAPPRGSAVPSRVSKSQRDVAQMQTTFMSPMAVRESMRKRQQRRVGAVFAGIAAVAVIAAIVASAAARPRHASPKRAGATVSNGAVTTPVVDSTNITPAATAPAVQPEPRLPDSVPPIESAPPSADEPITAGATKRPRP